MVSLKWKAMDNCRNLVKQNMPKIYSEELIEYLFYDFYTKNEYLRERLSISRNTAGKYLSELEELGVINIRTSWERKNIQK